MIPPRFEYHAPKSVGEAVALLGQLGSEAKLLAGGPTKIVGEVATDPGQVDFSAAVLKARRALVLRAPMSRVSIAAACSVVNAAACVVLRAPTCRLVSAGMRCAPYWNSPS